MHVLTAGNSFLTNSNTRPSFARCSLVLLLLALSVLPCNVFSAQNPPTVDREPQLSLGILVDTGMHQKKVIEFERETVNSIADAFKNAATESFVMKYGDEVELLRDWSRLETGARKAVTGIDLDMGSGKNRRILLNDAINAALLKLETRNGLTRKALIIIGEGNDAGSAVKYSQIKKLAKSSHVQYFALLVADHPLIGGRVRRFGFDLYDLAGATNGKAYDVGTSRKHLDKAVKDIVKRVSIAKMPALTSGPTR